MPSLLSSILLLHHIDELFEDEGARSPKVTRECAFAASITIDNSHHPLAWLNEIRYQTMESGHLWVEA